MSLHTRCRVAILVLNWNRAEETLACLDSLLPFAASGLASILVCDNHSDDDSPQHIRAWAEQHRRQTGQHAHSDTDFTLIRTHANLGYAGGNNAGLRYLLRYTQYEYIWLLNNDTVVDPESLPTLLAYADARPGVGLFGSCIIDYDQQDRIQYAGGGRYCPLTTVSRPVLQAMPLSALNHIVFEKLDYISGAAMLLRTEALRVTGLLDDTFFLYYEELDYARRLLRHGYTLDWCPASRVYHRGGSSTGGRTQHTSALAHYHENISTLKFTALHHPRLLPIAALIRLLAKSVLLPMRRQAPLLASLWRAYMDFWRWWRSSPRHRPEAETGQPEADTLFQTTLRKS